MSGYLQRLVERTLGSEAVVKPLIAPRFASPPAMGEEFGELRLMHDAAPGGLTMVHRSTSAVEEVSTEQILPATGPVDELPRVEAARPPSGNESHSLAPLQVQPGTENGEPTPHITLPAPTSTDVLTEQMTAAEDAAEEGSHGEVQHTSQIERSETGPSSVASAGIEELEAGLEREPTVHPIIQSLRWEAAVVQSDEAQSQVTARQAGEIDAGEPDRPRLGPDPSLPVANQLYEAELSSSFPTLRSIAESSLQAEIKPQPAIRVTIGRIEVRAVSPPVPAPRSSTPRPAPALSLQEYLEQRDGGKR